MYTDQILVELSGRRRPEVIYAKQADVAARQVEVSFLDHGQPYTIPTGTTARIRVTKPDRTYIFNNCTISENVVTAPLTAQTLAAAGEAAVDIALYQGEDELLSCSCFRLMITPRAGSDSAAESSDEFGALDKLLQEAETSIPAATDAAEAANEAANAANTAAGDANEAAGAANSAASAANSAASSANSAATAANSAANAANTAAENANDAAEAANEAAKPTQTVIDRIEDVAAYVGYTDTDIYGVEVDFTAGTFTRLAAAVGMSGGADFDSVACFGGRQRCNVTNEGMVVAYYGGTGYSETGFLTQEITIASGPYAGTYPVGTPVQVMVEQPKFYYKTVPLQVENTGNGQITRKMRYYVSPTEKEGFKLHPAFKSGNMRLEKIYLSAFEGCVFDTSSNTYVLDDAQTTDFSTDMLSSISGAKPASGLTQQLTLPNTRTLAENRGAGWEQQYAATVAASQLLMLIEYATFNVQTAIGPGVVNITDDGTSNMAVNTGATSSLGNASGSASNGSVTYRGEENIWGNIWKWVDGMNEFNPSGWSSSSNAGVEYGSLYIADCNFSSDVGVSPYFNSDLHPCYGEGYVSAFCYSEEFDWMFITGEVSGNSSLPVGDYFWNRYSGWQVAMLGGRWNIGSVCGGFSWYLNGASSSRYRDAGGRLVYAPQNFDSTNSVAYSPDFALVSGADGTVQTSNVTTTELGHLSGTTGNIQQQIGNLEDLTTTEKSSLVAAANELNGKIQSGICTVPAGGNGEITFNPPFSTPPKLVLSGVGSSTNTVSGIKIKSISATKAEILVVYATYNGVFPADSETNVHWIACT